MSDTNRPATVDDLSEQERRGFTVAHITGAEQVVRFPSLGQHLLAAVAEAERLGLTVKNGEIIVELNAEELEGRLVTAQRSWDYNEERYTQALIDPAGIEGYLRYSVNLWAARAGKPAIDWDAPAEVSA